MKWQGFLDKVEFQAKTILQIDFLHRDHKCAAGLQEVLPKKCNRNQLKFGRTKLPHMLWNWNAHVAKVTLSECPLSNRL